MKPKWSHNIKQGFLEDPNKKKGEILVPTDEKVI